MQVEYSFMVRIIENQTTELKRCNAIYINATTKEQAYDKLQAELNTFQRMFDNIKGVECQEG